jgi:hypothetical protein
MSTMSDTNVVTLAERKSEATGKAVVDFVRDHPGIVVAGGLALGLVAGALLAPRGSGRMIARRAISLAEAAGAASLALSRQAVDRAEDAGQGLRRQGEVIAAKAGKLAEPAEEAVDQASEAAHRLLRKAVELAGKLRA